MMDQVILGLEIIGIVLLLIIVLFVVVVVSIRISKANKIKITGEEGIQENSYLELGGLRQFVSIRGENQKNPLMVILHGGPGVPLTGIAYHYQTPLEKDYMVVNWEQRGCGRTYYESKKNKVDSDLSIELLLEDLDELVIYLLQRFKQEKVILVGFSWGTILGIQYILKNYRKVATYIGVGQMINTKAGEKIGNDEAIKRAFINGDEEVGKEIAQDYSDFFGGETYDMELFMKMHTLMNPYLTSKTELSALKLSWLYLTSPQLTIRDLRWVYQKPFAYQDALLETLFAFNIAKEGIKYEVPIHFVAGEYDWQTPFSLTSQYCDSLKAPFKQMILIEKASHSPFLDNPKGFVAIIKKILQ